MTYTNWSAHNAAHRAIQQRRAETRCHDCAHFAPSHHPWCPTAYENRRQYLDDDKAYERSRDV